jgi:hypothetical protein
MALEIFFPVTILKFFPIRLPGDGKTKRGTQTYKRTCYHVRVNMQGLPPERCRSSMYLQDCSLSVVDKWLEKLRPLLCQLFRDVRCGCLLVVVKVQLLQFKAGSMFFNAKDLVGDGVPQPSQFNRSYLPSSRPCTCVYVHA